ncbi:MAG: zinc-ribbon domain-containing protein [Phycisphaerae bacterium]
MQIRCPNCGAKLEANDSLVGKRVRCTKCEHVLTVPGEAGTAETANDQSAPDTHDQDLLSAAAEAKAGKKKAAGVGAMTLGAGDAGAGFAGIFTALTLPKLLLMVGLALVLLSRGCDSMAARNVNRARAALASARQDFESEWEAKLQEAREDGGDLREIQQQRNEARQKAEQDWRDLQNAVSSAATSTLWWGFWFECIFVLGTLVFVVGLLGTAFTGTTPERIFCMVLTVILTFSVYIGGIAWLASAMQTAGGIGKSLGM